MVYMIKIHVFVIIFLLFIKAFHYMPPNTSPGTQSTQGIRGVRGNVENEYKWKSPSNVGRSGTKPNDTKKTKK